MINPRKHLILLATSMIAANALADADIKGTILRKNTSEPIDFATVALINPQTGVPLQISTVSDANGQFLIPHAPSGNYLLRCSFLGSVTDERPVNVGESDINLGIIELEDDNALLSEVVVTGRKNQVSVGTEKRVFNVSSNIASSGASALELLAAVPSVDTDTDGNISLRGNPDVLVRINGKEMGMNEDNRAALLAQIPAESIANIEVMTNPSSRESAEGTGGIINIRLKEENRRGIFGGAEAGADTRGGATLGLNITGNTGKFESFLGLGLKHERTPGGSSSRRKYSDGAFLNSDGKSRLHDNSMFLRLGTTFRPDRQNSVYISAIGTLGHKWGNTLTEHTGNLPAQWTKNHNSMHQDGDTRGANLLLGYRHDFSDECNIDLNVSYNIWEGPSTFNIHEQALMPDGSEESSRQQQHQDVRINNWEIAADYTDRLTEWMRLETGFKGDYDHENSPASYAAGPAAGQLSPLPALFNRFKYATDISALYVNVSGAFAHITYSAGLRGELWQIRTRSLGYGQTDSDVPLFKKNDFALFPSASLGWSFLESNELRLNYSRRIRRPYGPQLNTFENISDPSEVHLGNPHILPEYSNQIELSYLKNFDSHVLSVSGYVRSHTDMISHVSFLAPMASDPAINTMYYGHANVGNMVNSGIEIISRNNLFNRLTLTTTLNLYNSHLKGWTAEYPLHDDYYTVSGASRSRFVWDIRCMASLSLPWDMTFQATGRYNSKRLTAQGLVLSDWDTEAAIRKTFGPWGVSLICKDIFNSKESRDILYGNGYTQSLNKWSEGRSLRLAVTFSFGKSDKHSETPHNHIDTGGYGEEGHQH